MIRHCICLGIVIAGLTGCTAPYAHKKDTAPGPPYDLIWDELRPGEAEVEDFHRYGYLLGHRPGERLDAAIEALTDLPSVAEVEPGEYERERFAVTYLFVKQNQPRTYHYARARRLMECLEPRLTHEASNAVYLVAVREPIAHCAGSCSYACLFVAPSVMNLSDVPPTRMRSWMQEYVRLMRADVDWVGAPPNTTMLKVRDFMARIGSSFKAAVGAAGAIKILWDGG